MFCELEHNYPQGYKKEPYCPNSTLVEICNSLSGNEVTPETFCTEKVINAQYSRGIINTLESADFYPVTSCAMSNIMLFQQLESVSHEIELPSEEEINEKVNNAKTIEQKTEFIESYNKSKTNFELRKTILERWRKVIFDTCCSTTEDKENAHFRRFSSASDLAEEEIVSKVKLFADALQEIIGYKRESLGWWGGNVENCPNAPHRKSIGGF